MVFFCVRLQLLRHSSSTPASSAFRPSLTKEQEYLFLCIVKHYYQCELLVLVEHPSNIPSGWSAAILRALAEGLVPGVPSNLRILLLGQTLVTTNSFASNSSENTDLNAKSVLEYVVSSNAARELILKQSECMFSIALNALCSAIKMDVNSI